MKKTFSFQKEKYLNNGNLEQAKCINQLNLNNMLSKTLNYDCTSYATTNDIFNAFLKHFESMIRILAKTFKEKNSVYLEKKDLSQLITELFGKNRGHQEKKISKLY